jgi:hypothetical protein
MMFVDMFTIFGVSSSMTSLCSIVAKGTPLQVFYIHGNQHLLLGIKQVHVNINGSKEGTTNGDQDYMHGMHLNIC